MTHTVGEINGPLADLAGEAPLVVGAIPYEHLLGLEHFPPAPRAPGRPVLSHDLGGGRGVEGQRGVPYLGVTHLAIHLVVKADKDLKK
jgi:hypothetical protein